MANNQQSKKLYKLRTIQRNQLARINKDELMDIILTSTEEHDKLDGKKQRTRRDGESSGDLKEYYHLS